MKDRLVTIVLSVAATYGLMRSGPEPVKELVVDRLIVRKELIVSDTGVPWEKGYEAHQIPRGSTRGRSATGPGASGSAADSSRGRSTTRSTTGSMPSSATAACRRAPGHISWNVWLDGAWRQMAIIQGEGLELSEVPAAQWNGLTHPGRLRFQTFRPGHGEPLTDALIGQGMMSVGGGGYGGGGLPYPSEVLQLWGGDDAAGDDPHAGGADRGEGRRLGRAPLCDHRASALRGVAQSPRPASRSKGLATLRWDSVPGADSYVVVRDGKELGGPLRIEGSRKEWTDRLAP